MEIKNLIYIIIAIFIACIIFKIFMWLLPIIVIILIAFFIYVYLSGRNNY